MILVNRILVVTLVLFVISLNETKTQEWQWDWIKNANPNVDGPFLLIDNNDKYNSNYFRGRYTSNINFPDTSFTHNVNPYTTNYAFAKYINRGDFLNAIDFYTIDGTTMNAPRMVINDNLNIFIGGHICDTVFFQDTLLVKCDTTYPTDPTEDIFITKMNQQYEVLWTGRICGTWQDYLSGFEISKNNSIYAATKHYIEYQQTSTVDFLGQDTAYYDDMSSSLMKLDNFGNILWRNNILGSSQSENLIIGENDYIYYNGSTNDYIIVEDDTIFNLNIGNVPLEDFILVFDTSGQFIKGEFLHFGVAHGNIVVNKYGELYTAGYIHDTMIVNQDTIIVPENWEYRTILKLDQNFQPIWYRIFPCSPNQYLRSLLIQLKDENLIFSTIGTKDVQILDTTVWLGYNKEVIFGELDSAGQLVNLLTTNSDQDLTSYRFLVNNCNDIVFTGFFKSEAYFNNDTLIPFGVEDCFIAKIKSGEYNPVNLGPDTTILENDSIIFEILDQYESYLWSDGSSTNTIKVKGVEYGVGTYPIWVEVTTGSCILSDTLYLNIKSEFGIDENSKNSIDIFPNPFEDEITVGIKPNYTRFEIFNLNGIKLFSKIPDKLSKIEQIKLENLSKGVYILKIRTEEKEITKKIIKI